MSKDILYSIGETNIGDLVNVSDAEKGKNYYCPFCKQPFILRKGNIKRAHFAHKNLSYNCSPETALHYLFKQRLYEKIKSSIEEKSPLKMEWECLRCCEIHTGNLLKKSCKVELEYNLGACRPDIALLNSKDRVIAAIEVIVTHEPEESTLDYYKENKIAVIRYKLKSDRDLDRLNTNLLKPDMVDVCTNPRCKKCGQIMDIKSLFIMYADCWKCKFPMNVAVFKYSGRAIDNYGIFYQDDKIFAEKHGAYIKNRYSRTMEESYLANTCRRCNAFIGQHYLFTEYLAVYGYEEDKHKQIDTYYCPYCDDPSYWEWEYEEEE